MAVASSTGGSTVASSGGVNGGGAPGPSSSGGTTPVSTSGGTGAGGTPVGAGGVPMGSGGLLGTGGSLPNSGGTTGMGGMPGMGGMLGTSGGGAAGMAGSAGAGGAMAPCMKGQTKGSQVVMIGDSYIQIPGTLQGDIQTLARMEGGLGASDTYRNYAVSGTSLGNGQIPSQYETAKTVSKDIKVVIMDGGGNDVLILNPQCLSAKPAANNASCVMTVQNATDAAKKLLDEMAGDGVEDVIYFFYPAVPAVTGDILDYSEPKAADFCNNATKPRCHFVSTKAAFAGKSGLIGLDNIHPTTDGAQLIANLIWDRMTQDCVAQ
jgi:lysophospholipase L1-like esterase